jgi:hypothetical protein
VFVLVASGAACAADSWYTPVEKDFTAAYSSDRADMDRQTWSGANGYWSWVRTFYAGIPFFRPGWTDTMQSALTQVNRPEERSALVARLNRMGRTVAADWAKDDHIRHISTDDLKTWFREVQAAASASYPPDAGQRIDRCLDTIDREMSRKLAGPPAGR